ncbi:MAG: chromosomal replication initiator protein DnaA [Candidatus Brocadiae bacterium]|nr:chromosomal replication initiator protein DnaA [Candidatus Brocadiia bacterium]
MAAPEPSWDAILEEISRSVRPQQFDTWFRNVRASHLSQDTLSLSVPNSFYQDWLRRHYQGAIEQAVHRVTGWKPAIEFLVQPDAARPRAEEPPTAVATPPPDTVTRLLTSSANTYAPRAYYPVDWAARLNRHYTFENFVVGPTNQLAHAAAMAICDSAAHAYNPLFIHGGVGLGKTHLVQAITHWLVQKDPSARIVYLSCENFMNYFTSSIQHNEREKFRNLYRSLDILLIDDIHFLSRGRREMTQEELFHTFNTLRNAEKQIVISSDTPPEELPNFEERLVSRFKWGLVARVDPPTYETRVAILRKKADVRGRHLPDEVIHFIAEHVDTNIRELEGAVTKVIAFASVTNAHIDLALAEEALRDTVQQAATIIGMDDIVRTITAEFHVKLSELQSKRRSKSLTHPRQMAMYLARTLTHQSLSEIGGYFGGRDHTTVMHACDKIRGLIQHDPSVNASIERLTTQLRSRR